MSDPLAEIAIDIAAQAIPVEHQVNVYVRDPEGRPLEGAIVRIYRTIPFTLVDEKTTDARGYAYFDGLWTWNYCLAADHEKLNLTTPPVHFTVMPGETYTFNLTATPPPHTYELRIQCGLTPIAAISEWLVNNVSLIRDTIIGYPNHEFIDAHVEDSFLVIVFRVTGSPFPWAVIGALLAILTVLAIIFWEIKEIAVVIPPVTFPITAVGIAAFGLASLLGAIVAISKRRRE